MKANKNKADANKLIKDKLAQNHACYVLVTCDEPSEDGDMRVEMSYHGDASLASMLLHGAQTYIDEKHEASDYE
jgi:hypothetical protein